VTGGYRARAPGDTSLVASLLRHTAFGTLDTTWDGDGAYELLVPPFPDSVGNSIAIDAHDRVLVSGTVDILGASRWYVARLDTGQKMMCKP
jgi:hypothetical protein